MITIDDSHILGGLFPMPCLTCKHFHSESVQNKKPSCEAFAHIPKNIWSGKNQHTEFYPNDKGIIYESKFD